MVGHYHEIRAGLAKRKERLLRRKDRGEEVTEEELRQCDPEAEGEQPFSIDDVPLTPLPADKVLCHLPTATPQNWLRENEEEEETTMTTKEEEETIEPKRKRKKEEEQNDLQRLRTRVFEELWHQGHHVTVSTAKMGGDFLLYPGELLINVFL